MTNRALIFAAGVAAGIASTWFTGLLTELILIAVIVGLVIYLWRKRWGGPGGKNDIPSTTKTSL